MDIPEQVINIINTLEKAEFEAYIVGGCVRDYLLGKTPKDWDITTSALPAETKKLFSHTYDTGIAHGTITIVKDKTNYEVTTYRIDGVYSDFRHPETVTYTKKIEEDLSRRDFTMNAIAYNEKKGFCDPYKGRDDIKAKLIKGVGNPDKRFSEDALRMLRGVRFSAQLNFKIEENTYNSIVKNAGLIKNISVERIREELTKLLLSPNPEKITELKNTGLLKEILPEINENIYENCKTAKILKILSEKKNTDISAFYCGILYSLTEKEAYNIMKNLKFDTKTVKETSSLVKYSKRPIETGKYEIRKTLSETGKELYEKIIRIKKALYFDNEEELLSLSKAEKLFCEIMENNDCYSLKSLKINGNILKEMGVTKGKEIGTILNLCLETVLKNPEKNTEKELINCVKKSQKP